MNASDEDRILRGIDEIRPGYFTEFEGGLLIGAHPDALDEPLTVEVEWFDPADDRLFPFGDRRIRAVERFVEITATGLPDDVLSALASREAGFYVAFPVPEYFDTSHLMLAEYAYADHGQHVDTDLWLFTDVGAYDRSNGLFFARLIEIGGEDYPVRMGLFEHATLPTDATAEFILEDLIERFRRAEEDPRRPETAPGSEEPVIEPMSTVEFDVRWNADSASENQALMDLVEDALHEGMEVYPGLVGNDGPRMSTGFLSSSYRYYIEGDGDDSPWYVSSGCDGGTWGYYTRTATSGRAVTCLSSGNPARTTRHELFHAFQHGYMSYWQSRDRVRWIMEGTATVAENLALLDIRTESRPLDIRLTASSSSLINRTPYRTELFWVDLFQRSNLGLMDLGRLFSFGASTSDAIDFIQQHTPFNSLGEAYWHWARNAAFEADLDPGEVYGEPGEVNEDAFHGPLPVLEVDAGTGGGTTSVSLASRTARMIHIQLPAQTENHYYEITFQTNVPQGARARIYSENENHFIARNPDAESGLIAGTAGSIAIPGPAASGEAFLLIANPGGQTGFYQVGVNGPHADDQFFPVAEDIEVTYPAGAGSAVVDVLSSASGGADTWEDLVIVDPPSGGAPTSQGGTAERLKGVASPENWETIRYTPPGFRYQDSFSYTVENSLGLQDSATVTVVRDAEPPIARDVERGVTRHTLPNEALVVTVDVLANDTNPMESVSPLSLSVDSQSSQYADSLTVSADGTKVVYVVEDFGQFPTTPGLFTPLPSVSWSDSFTYTIQNAGGADTATVYLDVCLGFGCFQPELRIVRDIGDKFDLIDLMENLERERILLEWLEEEGLLGGFFMGPGMEEPVSIGMLDGRGHTVPKEISDLGQAVGWSHGEGEIMQAFVWSAGEGIQALETDPGMRSRALGINNAGIVAGQVGDARQLHSQAGYWKDGRFVEIELPGDGNSLAMGVNDAGHVFGLFDLPDNPVDPFGSITPGLFDKATPILIPQALDRGARAFLYDLNEDEFLEIEPLGGNAIVPLDIDERGRVVGVSTTGSEERGFAAFVWLGGETRALGALGGLRSDAFSINNHGTVVGSAETEAGERHGFLWHETLGTIDLNDIVDPESWPTPDNWVIVAATRVNDAGTITARIEDPHGRQSVTVALAPHVPEPLEWPEGSELRVADVTEESVTLRWAGAGEPDGVFAYRILQDGIEIAVIEPGLTRHTVGNLRPGSEYIFQIQAAGRDGIWSGDGTVVRVETLPAAGTYAARIEEWADEYQDLYPDLTEEDLLPDADLSRDGTENIAVFAFGGNPFIPGSGREGLPTGNVIHPEGEEDEPVFIVTFTRRRDAADLEYIVEVADDLFFWDDSGGRVTQAGDPLPSPDGETEVVHFEIEAPDGEQRTFVRVRLEHDD